MPQKMTQSMIEDIVNFASQNHDGDTANYIPELENVDKNLTAMAVQVLGEPAVVYSNQPLSPVTLQSVGKLVPLIGLLEEFGLEQLLEWVKVEPSGDDFASVTRLEKYGPKPSNPMLNAGAITLCSHIPGVVEQQYAWLERWMQRLFNQKLNINAMVFASEKRTGDRNRSLAYTLNCRHYLGSDVVQTLDLYFALCSYEATIEQMIYLPTLLANNGVCPLTNERVISSATCKTTVAIMATCGLYDETGTHMVLTGMPAKSGVSGYTIAVMPGRAGIVTLSPRVNPKGNSIRGEIMLERLSMQMNWHFAAP